MFEGSLVGHYNTMRSSLSCVLFLKYNWHTLINRVSFVYLRYGRIGSGPVGRGIMSGYNPYVTFIGGRRRAYNKDIS